MRLFVAIDLDAVVSRRLGEAIERYRAIAPDARWTRVESMHLTLKFIGEVPPEREPELIAVLQRVDHSAVKLAFGGLGVFPNNRQPRVFWAGVRLYQELTELARKVDEAVHRLGFPLETRAFSPHLTLARARGPRDLKPLVPSLNPDEPHWGDQVATQFFLYQSHPGRGGYQYEKRHAFPLAE
jgi:2'-5' RNA ligase